jgi:flagellar L-ring protein FlgH
MDHRLMSPLRRLLLLACLASSSGIGCGPRHIEPFTPRERRYKVGRYAQTDKTSTAGDGSLFSEAYPGFLEDTRAVRLGDLIIIRIDEKANARGASTTALKKESSGATSASALMGLLPALKKAYPTLNTDKLLEFASKSGFAGEGDTARKGELTGNIAVRVMSRLPNGDLYLEGTKVVLINHEETHLYVSGVVRRADIAPDNSVASSMIADAQIEFTGRGDIDDQQRKGWLARALDSVNPF